ncbi:MAG: VOC family protein [Gemmatimonadota bacterium]
MAGPEAPAPEPPAAPPVGSVGWRDLTVEDAEAIRDFYRSVVGWSAEDVSMGEYADYTMVAADGTPTAGVCHARGGNADLPPSWLVYVVVDDVAAAVREAEARGGAVVSPARTVGGARMAVIRDPAGAVLALYQPPEGG